MTTRLEKILNFAQTVVFIAVGVYGNLVVTPWLAGALFAFSWILLLFPPEGGSRRERFFEKAIVAFVLLNSITFVAEAHWNRTEVITLIRRGQEVHIGDYRLSRMQPAAPSGPCFERPFELTMSPDRAALYMNVKDVDPDPDRGPFVIIINGEPSILVNKHPVIAARSPEDEHSTPALPLEFELPTESLRPGLNQLAGCALRTPFGDFDDVNIYELEIRVTRRLPWRG